MNFWLPGGVSYGDPAGKGREESENGHLAPWFPACESPCVRCVLQRGGGGTGPPKVASLLCSVLSFLVTIPFPFQPVDGNSSAVLASYCNIPRGAPTPTRLKIVLVNKLS